MKYKMLYIIIAILIIVGVTAYFLLKPKFKLSQTIESPDKEYYLEIYTQTNFKHIGLSNQSAYKKAYVILKDKTNETLAKPGLLSSCLFTLVDLKVYWELENEKVYFTKFNYIDLKDNSFSCQ